VGSSADRGDIARRILAFNHAEGGLLDEDDLASFRVGIEPPVRGQFGDVTVMTCGPWYQGPMLLQELALPPAALARYGHNTPKYIHEIVEAIKLAAAATGSRIGRRLAEALEPPQRGCRGAAVGHGRRKRARHLVSVRRRSLGQRLLGDPERRQRHRPDRPRIGLCALAARLAVAPGAGPCLLCRARQAAPADAEPP